MRRREPWQSIGNVMDDCTIWVIVFGCKGRGTVGSQRRASGYGYWGMEFSMDKIMPIVRGIV